MADKRSESNISTNETKKAAVLSHMGNRTAACLLMLYSFLASVFKSHQSIRALCCISEMSPLAWKNRFSEKSVFPNFSAREKPVKMQKHRTFVRCFLCCIFHQHILELLTRFELVTSSLPTTVEPSSPCCIRLCGVFLSKKDEVAACLFHCFRPLISPCGSRCGSNNFQDANEGRTSDSGKPSRCALSRS